MKTIPLGILIMAVALPALADSVTFSRFQGGPPLPGVTDAAIEVGRIQGEDFTRIKPQLQRIIATVVKHERWLPRQAAWYDVGPDAGYMSAVVEFDGKKYAIHSWYPLERSSTNMAVSETRGLVPVKSKEEKDTIEAGNTAAYREIVSIFDLIPRTDTTKEPAAPPSPTLSWDDLLNPWEVAAGEFEKRQLETERNKNARVTVAYTFTRVEYAGKTFWVSDAHYGDGVAYKSIAIYAPAKDGAFQRVLVAASNQAGWLAVTVDAKTGVLELRERANSELKGEVVLSCNLKTVGTAYSTGIER